MKKLFFSAILSLVFVFLANGLAQAQQIKITGAAGDVKRGGSTNGRIVMDIPGSLHVNSNRPNSEYAIPTSIKLIATGVRVGAVNYPRGVNRKFEFSDTVINVYEGRVVFTFNLTVPSNFKGSSIPVRAVVRYQACTDEVCYPPRNQTINFTARIR
ncbi:MAG TPA: protein-disulfide reductase DsbD domain-containing protein [Pyrinomonadaceae bacterium]|nr:protein-disulfide reductase DsbD domain-containing protein [Pyrinomonadaceae bacterium]